jgi:4'-phosphopantetheinyl transferase
VKARGGGLQIPLKSFDVSLAPDEQAAFLSEGEIGWSLEALPLEPDYAAAVAVEGNDWQLRLWQWRILPGG